MNWQEARLEDCCVSITDGDHQPPPKSDTGIPFITIANINSFNKIDFTSSMHVPKDYYSSLNGTKRPSKDDILYSVVGSFGIPVFLKEDIPFVFQRHIALLRPNKDIIYPKFLYYKLLSRDFYQQADTVAIGAAQRTIGLASLRKMTIVFPVSYKEQEKIANALSAYDDLIENNQKQIKLLEEAAQRLYKEWFVNLRFPGYEQTRIVDGVPVGWRKGCLDSFFEISIGKTPPRSESKWFREDIAGIPWVSISDMNCAGVFIFKTTEQLIEDAIKRFNIKIVPQETVFVSFKLTVGRVGISAKPMCTNEAIAHIQYINPILREYLYHYLKNYEYDALGNTSSISKAINSKIIKSIPFIMPIDSILVKFHSVLKPIIDEIYHKQLSVLRLTEARDRLLPKLMNGEIEL